MNDAVSAVNTNDLRCFNSISFVFATNKLNKSYREILANVLSLCHYFIGLSEFLNFLSYSTTLRSTNIYISRLLSLPVSRRVFKPTYLSVLPLRLMQRHTKDNRTPYQYNNTDTIYFPLESNLVVLIFILKLYYFMFLQKTMA